MVIPPGLMLPLIPLEVLLSTKGLMFLLLSAYGGAMWTFLSGAPRVHTIIVPDLEQARGFYEKVLKLPEAELPLQYYYGYEQSMVGYSLGSAYFPGDIGLSPRFDAKARPTSGPTQLDTPGLWYQLSDNVQLHVIPGSTDPYGGSGPYGSTSRPSSSPASAYGTVPAAGRSSGVRYRHVSYERESLKALLKRINKQGIRNSIRSEKPFVFWVRDHQGQIIEFAELKG
jgi:catechol 2,3-dioxygenase-like lactoylglutathione lyase family enzyme